MQPMKNNLVIYLNMTIIFSVSSSLSIPIIYERNSTTNNLEGTKFTNYIRNLFRKSTFFLI